MSAPIGISWTGCPAALACWHYRKERRGRVTALCRACSKVPEIWRRTLARKKREKGDKP